MNGNIIIPITMFITYVLLAGFCYYLGCRSVKSIEDNNEKIKEKNIQLNIEQENLQDSIRFLSNKIDDLKEKLNQEEHSLELEKQQVQFLQERKDELENNIKVQELSAKAQAHALYQNKVIEMSSFFEQDRKKLQNQYNNLLQQNKDIELEIEQNEEKLKSLKETRAAAITAAQQEKFIQENQDNYCLKLPKEYSHDVSILRDISGQIAKPRSILMAIGQAYYQPLAKKKFPEILGSTNSVCGIYKITNQKTSECYIGQAVDIRRRGMDHCKMGLGIDTPQGNQLYTAMLKDGLDSFSFELLLECEPNELNEKEKYFIELYNSDAIGYNMNKGVKNG